MWCQAVYARIRTEAPPTLIYHSMTACERVLNMSGLWGCLPVQITSDGPAVSRSIRPYGLVDSLAIFGHC